MVGELITFPLRVTAKAAHLGWRTADQALSLSWSAAGYVIERVTPDRPQPPSREAASPAPMTTSRKERDASRVPEPQPISEPLSMPESPPVAPAEEPAHVSEEPELVEEFAEPGAEDGAGAELHIREPWDGYHHLSASEVTARLSGASAADLAAVQLYESSNRRRRTILAAAARQLRSTQS